MPTTITKHRIVHPSGFIEFPEGQLAEAITYRDAHYPGSPIVTVTEEITE